MWDTSAPCWCQPVPSASTKPVAETMVGITGCELLYYASDLAFRATNWHLWLEKVDCRKLVPNKVIVDEFLDQLSEKGYRLSANSLIYGTEYEEIYEREKKLANLLPQCMLGNSDWTTKTYTSTNAHSTNPCNSSMEFADLETNPDSEEFNHFMAVLEDITQPTHNII